MNTKRRTTSLLALTALAFTSVLGAVSASADEYDDPNLDQMVEDDEPFGTDHYVITRGHVDLGPRIIDDEWTSVARDDSVIPALWRYMDDFVLHVLDEAMLTLPEGDDYAFIGVDAGGPVHVIPQTENPQVVWLGWNTQDPEVVANIERGLTLRLHRTEGPGDVVMFLQAGNFSEPQVLWDSRVDEVQEFWVETNTHTHSNWVFTEPGAYLMEIEFAATLLDGTEASHKATLRLAVGSETDPDQLFDMELASDDPAPEEPSETAGQTDEPSAPGTEEPDADTNPVDDEADDGSAINTTFIIVAGGAALLLIAGVVAVMRGRNARRRAEAELTDDNDKG